MQNTLIPSIEFAGYLANTWTMCMPHVYIGVSGLRISKFSTTP